MGKIHPISGETPNSERAEWARLALDAFCLRTFGDRRFGDLPKEERQEAIGDLISDLLHLALIQGIDPDDVVVSGVANFATEVAQEIEDHIH